MKTTTDRIVRLILVLVITACIAGIATMLLYAFVRHITHWPVWCVFGGITLVLAIPAGILSWRTKHARREWIEILVVAGFLVYLRWDCAPPVPDHTWADLPQPPRAEESRALQQPLTKGAREPVRMAQADIDITPYKNVWPWVGTNTVSDYCKYSNEIEATWAASSNCRALYAKLDSFDGIADVTTNAYGEPLLNFLEQRKAAQFITVYALLKARQGNAAEGVDALALQHSLMRKALPYSTTLVGKMILIATVGLDVGVAYDIANNTNTPLAVLRTMKDKFPPLPPKDISLESAIMGEITFMHDGTRKMRTNPRCLWSLFNFYGGGGAPAMGEPPHTLVERLFMPFIFNRNMTLRDCHRIMDPVLAGVRKVPMECDGVALELACARYGNPLRILWPKNIVGKLFIKVYVPNCVEASRKANVRKAALDLLAVRIGQRLGEPVEIMDYFSGQPYLVDKTTGAPYSAGPDKIPDTDDDIRLQPIR